MRRRVAANTDTKQWWPYYACVWGLADEGTLLTDIHFFLNFFVGFRFFESCCATTSLSWTLLEVRLPRNEDGSAVFLRGGGRSDFRFNIGRAFTSANTDCCIRGKQSAAFRAPHAGATPSVRKHRFMLL